MIPPATVKMDLRGWDPPGPACSRPARAGRAPSRKRGAIRWPAARGGPPARRPARSRQGSPAQEIMRPEKEDPRAEGGLFGRVGGLLRELSDGNRSAKIQSFSRLEVVRMKSRSLVAGRPRPRRRGLLRAPGVSAEVLEQVLVKVNGDILTKTELEAKQIAALRRADQLRASTREAMKNDATLKKMIAEVTPKILVETIDEMLLLQLGKEKGYHVTDQQFKDWVAEIRKNQGLDDDQKFKAGARAGRHDDGRPASQFRASGHGLSRPAGRGRAEAADYRRRGASVLSPAPVGIRGAGNRHAPRDRDRDSNDDPGRPGRHQRRPGRCGEEEGGGHPRACDGGRGLRQGRLGGFELRRPRRTAGSSDRSRRRSSPPP